MHVLFRRAVVIAGAAAMVLGSAAGIASASGAPVLAWSPTTSAGTFDFGGVNAGTTTPARTFTLANSGGSATADLKVAVGGPFTVQGDTCTGTSLGPHKSCTVQVTYTASSPGGGTDTGSLTAKGVRPNVTAGLTLRGESKTAAQITGFSIYFAQTGTNPYQYGGVTGTGFLPDANITFTVTGSGVVANYLNGPNPWVTTDATGAFNSAPNINTVNYAVLTCAAGSVTVTATDGTNTATGTFSYPAC